MKISEERLQTMYELAGLNKQTLHDALRIMGKKHLKTKLMKEGWTHDNPTKNYCYVIAEFVYYYLSPRGSKPYKLLGILEMMDCIVLLCRSRLFCCGFSS